MKHTLLTLTIASLLATTAFADPIHDAARDGDLAGVQAELDNDVDVNAKDDEYGSTPLHEAAGWGHKEIVELLIDKGADVNAKDKAHGGTPLHNAAYWGEKEIVELLIAAGADVNAKREDGSTPLHRAARRGRKEVVELLIAEGAEVNVQQVGLYKGITPLDRAIAAYANANKRAETVDLLRAHGGMTGAELDALALLPLLTAELTFTAVSEVPTVYAMARGSGSCNGADISGSFVILYGSEFNLRIVKKSDYSSVFKADTQLEKNLNGVMTVALNRYLFSTSFSNTEELMAVPHVGGKWDTTKAVPVTRYRNLSFDASKKTKAAQWQSAE